MLLVVGDHTNVLIRLSKPEQWLFGMSIQYLQQENYNLWAKGNLHFTFL